MQLELIIDGICKKTVYVFSTSPVKLKNDMWKALKCSHVEHLGLNRLTLVKINGNYDRVYPGSNTSPWFLDKFLGCMTKIGFKNLKVIECDLPCFTASDMIRKTGLEKILEKNVVEFLSCENLPRDSKKIPLILKDVQLINMPVFHSHGLAVMSCATKNLFGLLPKNRRKYHKCLTEKLVELWQNLNVFTIVDGTVGLIGESTRRGKPVRLDLIISGWDTLAVDYVVTKIMGFDPMQIPLLKYVIENGLLKKQQIQLRGDFTWETLPRNNFQFAISLQRKTANILESTFLENIPIFRWFETKIEKIYHGLTYLRKKRKLFKGPWMEYAKYEE
jgi:uncharacterized protein (DUF362 family)